MLRVVTLAVLAILISLESCSAARFSGFESPLQLSGRGNHEIVVEDDAMLMEGGSNKEPSDDPDDPDFCYNEIYRKHTMKAIWEMPFIGLFTDLRNQTKFEASGATIANGYAWVIFDSLRSIGRVSKDFNFRSDENILVPELSEEERESQFEGLEYSPLTDTYITVTETFVPDGTKRFISRTEEVKMADDYSSFHVIRQCLIDFTFENVNKGFEGIYYFDRDGERYIMGLCESNYCKSTIEPDDPGNKKGHGRVVLAKMVEGDDCYWRVEKILHIPKDAYFTDYSEIAFNGIMGSTVAVTSQEDAAVWIGTFDWEALEFVEGGRVFHFPRNEHCEKVYCNVEGIHFLDDHRLFVTTDKSKPIQPHSCMHKDQMALIMAIGKY